MAAAETAKLFVSLEFVDRFSKGIGASAKKLDGLSASAKRAGKGIGIGLAAGAAVGIAALGAAITSGIGLAAELETANTETAGALKVTGLAASISAEQIRDWSNALEESSGFAVDDKAIQRAANTLIRFGNVSETNLKRALAVSVDLAPKFGSVESAAETMYKAMADPTKATRALRGAGVSLTKAQTDLIKSLVKAGKTEQAQAVILTLLEKKTKGAAAASQGPYAKAIAALTDAWEDARIALAEGFLPVLQRVATKLRVFLADPRNVQRIRDFGQGLADAFEKVVAFAEKIPWDKIGAGLSIAAGAAKTLIGAFTSMPVEVQGTILALAGLNKISGGAVSGIVGELGKGLVKGVLGLNAGVVNAKAGVVNVSGGVVNGPGGGGTPGAGAAGSLLGVGGALGLATLGAGIAGILALYIAPLLFPGKATPGAGAGSQAAYTNPNRPLAGANSETMARLVGGMPSALEKAVKAGSAPVVGAIGNLKDETRAVQGRTVGALEQTRQATEREIATTRGGLSGLLSATNRTTAGTLATAAAVRRQRTSVNVDIPVSVYTNVSIRNSVVVARTRARYVAKRGAGGSDNRNIDTQ